MLKYLLFVFLLISSIAYANTEISTPGTNISIGTTDTSNALGIASTLAVGGAAYTETAAPTNGAIIQGNVGIGSSNPGDNLDVVGTARVSGHVTLEGVTSTGATGTGNLVFGTSPTLVTPALGTPSALVGTNISGTASSLTAGHVTTNANLTGPITSTGNATAIASQTGTGTKFVVDTAPTIQTSLNAAYATISTPAAFDGSKNLISGSYSGNTTKVATSSGTLNSGDCVSLDASGNYVDAGSACGGSGSGISTITDGVNTVTGATQLTVTGGTVGGSTPNATLSIGAGSNYWKLNGGVGNVGISTTNTVGIGTTQGNGSLLVFGGNVGIGTANPISSLQVNGTTTTKALGTIQIAANFPGADCGAKINAAITALSSSPGEVWVDSRCGMTISTAVTIGAQQVLRFVQGGVWTISNTITSSGSIIGEAVGSSIPNGTTVALKQANSTNLAYMVRLASPGASIENIEVNGNKANNSSTATIGIDVYRATSTVLRYNYVHDTHGVGIEDESTSESSEDANVMLADHNFMYNTDGDCMQINNAPDAVLTQNFFENCVGHGLQLNNSGGARITGTNDFGIDTLSGLYITGTTTGSGSPFVIVTGNQFGNNLSHDIEVVGRISSTNISFNNTITGNMFFSGSGKTSNTYDAIRLEDSFGNAVSGNAIDSSTSGAYKYGIDAVSTGNSGIDSWTGNTLDGSFGTAACLTISEVTISTGNTDASCNEFHVGSTIFQTPTFSVDGNGSNVSMTAYYNKTSLPTIYAQLTQLGASGSDLVFAGGGAGYDFLNFVNDGGTRMSITSPGNVGIGSANPGDLLDVAGTARMTGFNMPTSVTNGYVLTTDSSGNGTWKAGGGTGSPGGSSPQIQFNNSGSFGGIAGSSVVGSNIGIGTTTPLGSLTIMGGNVGIGTWNPTALLQVGNLATGRFFVGSTGSFTSNGGSLTSTLSLSGNNISMGSGSVTATSGGFLITGAGNIGIGTAVAGRALTIGGTSSLIRMEDSSGVSWSCGPAVTTGVFTCTSP